jgi:hypothetical protein
MVQGRQDWFFCEVYGKVFVTVGSPTAIFPKPYPAINA